MIMWINWILLHFLFFNICLIFNKRRLPLQNISSFSSNLRIKVQSRGPFQNNIYMFLLKTQNIAYQKLIFLYALQLERGKRDLFRIRQLTNILLLRTDRTKKYTWAPTVISLVLTISGKITCNIISGEHPISSNAQKLTPVQRNI